MWSAGYPKWQLRENMILNLIPARHYSYRLPLYPSLQLPTLFIGQATNIA